MRDNFANIYKTLESNWNRYEKMKNGGNESLWEKMLNDLKAPYNDMPNHDEFLHALKGLLSEDEIKVWYAFPDYSYDTDPVSLEEVKNSLGPEFAASFDSIAASLESKYMILKTITRSGKRGYQRNYFFYIVYYYLLSEPDSVSREMWDASLRWWIDVLQGESAHLNSVRPEYRVMPHQGTLTGETKFGKIPMNIDIPDTRQVLPMDKVEEVLKSCHSIAVIDCICRMATDMAGIRECDHPVKDICFLFNEAADVEIAAGTAKPVTLEWAVQRIAEAHEMGLMQEISNAVNPLSMCNCCRCCCVCVASQRRNEDTVSSNSRFVAENGHMDRCIGCGACIKACPMDAIKVVQAGSTSASAQGHSGDSLGAGSSGTADNTHTASAQPQSFIQVDAQRCFGCGLCVSKCPKGVLRMRNRPGASETDTLPAETIHRIYA